MNQRNPVYWWRYVCSFSNFSVENRQKVIYHINNIDSTSIVQIKEKYTISVI